MGQHTWIAVTGHPAIGSTTSGLGGALGAAGLGRLGAVALAHLVDERPRPVPRDALADALWGEALPRTWEATLRGVIGKLRRALAAAGLDPTETLVTSLEGYQLVLPDDVRVDVEEAEVAVSAAELRLERAPAEAAPYARQALELTAAPLLPNAAGGWVERRQRRWRELRVRALEAMALAASAAGDAITAAASAAEAVMLEPLRESAHVALMTAHAAAGNRAEALRAYERCRQTLIEELGVGPSAATEAVYLRLLDDLGPAAEASGTQQGERRVGVAEAARAQQEHRHPLPAQLRTDRHPRLVGRKAALDQLVLAWEEAIRGSLGFAVITGEAGIGKTRLAAELVTSVDPPTVLYGRCDDDAVVPYQPFIHAIRRHVIADPDAVGGLPPPLRTALARLVPELADASAAAADEDRHRLFDAVAGYLTTCVDGPAVFVIDDLHWASGGSVSMLRHLLRTPAPSGLLVVATARVDEPSDNTVDQLAGLTRELPSEHVVLEGLAVEEAADLTTALAGRPLAPRLVRALSSAARGNPFLLCEITHHLHATGGLEPAAAISDRLGDGQPGDALLAALDTDVPTGVHHLVQARLQALGATTTSLLEAAAVAGASFEVDVPGRVTGLAPDELAHAVDGAVSTRVIEPVDGRADRYRFVHAVVRRAIYTRVGPRRRAHLHEAVLHALEDRHRATVEPVLPQLAHHARHAASVTLEPGRAIDYARRAGDQAMSRFAYEDAAHHYEGAAELASAAGTSPAERAGLHLAIGEARWRTGELRSARRAFLDAAALARGMLDGATLARAALGLGGLWERAGSVDDDLVRLLDEALAALPPGDSPARAMLLGRLGRALYYTDTWDGRGRELCAEAAAMAVRTGDPEAIRTTLVARHMLLWGPEHLAERLALAEEMVEQAHAAGDLEHLVQGLLYRITARLEVDDLAGATLDVATYGKLAEELRQPLHTWHARYLTATLAIAEGRLDEAEQLVVAAAAAGEDAHDPDAGHFFGIQLLCLRREQGRLGELAAAVEAFAAQYPAVPAWRAAQAYVAAETGRLDDARRALATVGPLRRDANWLIATTLLAETAATVGDAELAASLYEQLLPHDGQNIVIGPAVALNRPAAYHLGRLAAAAGRHDRAVRHLEAALGMALAAPGTPDEVRIRAELGRVLRARGRPDDLELARDHIVAAGAGAERLGMHGLVEQLRSPRS